MTKKTFLSRVEAGILFSIIKYSRFLNWGLFCCNTILCGCRHDGTFSALPAGVGAWTKVKVAQLCQLFATPWTIQFMEFSRPEYWSGWPFPSPGDLPNSGIEPRSPTLRVDSLSAEPQGKSKNTGVNSLSLLQLIFLTQELNQGLLYCRWILY